MSHLTSVKQKIHEGVSEYIRRFRDTRNRCYRDLADLVFAGLLDFYKAKLEGQKFLDVSQVLQKAMAKLKRIEIHKSLMRSLIVLFMCLGAIQIVQTMKIKMFMLLNLFCLPVINLAFVVLLSRFTKIGKKDLLLMYPNVREYLMNYIRMDTSKCRMSYHRLRN